MGLMIVQVADGQRPSRGVRLIADPKNANQRRQLQRSGFAAFSYQVLFAHVQDHLDRVGADYIW